MKTKLTPEDFIKKIRPIRPNFEYCAENNRINGTLFVDIKNAIIEYHAQFWPIEPQEEHIPNVGKTIELREELISFARQFYADEETCIHNVDEYLKLKRTV